MLRTLAWMMGLLLLSTPGGGWGERLAISVRSETLVPGADVTIGDVADVRGDNPETVRQVQGIVIGQAPPAGEERILYGGYIVTRLKQYGFNPEEIQLHIPEKLHVTRAFQRFEPREVEAAVVQAIRKRIQGEAQQITIREIRGLKPVILPPGPVEYDVSFPANTDFLGPTSFSLTFRVNRNMEKQLYGTAYIEALQDVVVLRRSVARGDIIEAEDIRLEQMNLSQLPRQVITHPEDAVGKRARRFLPPQAPLRSYEVETQPLIKKGDIVVIRVDSPLLKVTTLGEALERGLRGESIRVKNLSSNREIRAVVVDKKTVRVPF